jgi:hypothetical protein
MAGNDGFQIGAVDAMALVSVGQLQSFFSNSTKVTNIQFLRKIYGGKIFAKSGPNPTTSEFTTTTPAL